MKLQITLDEKGMSVWPKDVDLKFNGKEWVDRNCDVRGTNGIKDWETFRLLIDKADNEVRYNINVGDRYTIEVIDINQIDKGKDG